MADYRREGLVQITGTNLFNLFLSNASDQENKRKMVTTRDIDEMNSLIIAQLAAEKNKTGIPIAKIDRNYREETGERIPYTELGFSRLIDYLKTVPGIEVVEIHKKHYVNFLGTEDSQHIVDLVAKQRYRNPSKANASNNQYYRKYINAPLNSFRSSTRVDKNNVNDNRGTRFDYVIEDLDYSDDDQEIKNISKNATNPMKRKYFSQNKNHVSTVLSERIKFRLEKLIQSHPQGIWCTELLKLYEDEYKIPLEWTNLGFQRLSDFTTHLSDIFHTVGPQSNGDFKLYNAKEPLPDEKLIRRSSKSIAASLIADDLSKHGCPNDVITIQESVRQILVTDLIMNSNSDDIEKPHVEVKVVESHSPSFFWIRLRTNENEFYKMMKSLGEFYNANYQKYAVPEIMLQQGLNIACVFYGKWHRAIVKKVHPDDRVTILFYDYGTVNRYPFNEVFYLHRSFTVLPAQAIPCGLYGIAPHKDDKWSTKVRDCFSKLISKKPLWATIVERNTERNSMLVILADTSGNDDFFINDWLIDVKMARVEKKARIRPKNFVYEHYLQSQKMKNNLNIQAPSDQNTSSISNDKKIPSSESPLSRRMNLLKKLRSLSYQAESNGNTQMNKTCPTCGNSITKLVEQELDTEHKPEITHLQIENESSIEHLPYSYNENKLHNKVISWLRKMNHSENVEVSSKLLNNCFVKDKINEGDMNISSKCLYDTEENISLEKKLKPSSCVINNSEDRKNNYQYENYKDEKLSCNDHLISQENIDTKLNSSITQAGKFISLVHDFQSIDENSNNRLEDEDQWPRKVEPIDWDEIKTTLNKGTKQRYHDSATSQKPKSIFIEKLLSSKEQSHTIEKINGSFKNFIEAYYPFKSYKETVLSLKPEHKIVNSDVITPMVIKTLNMMNKPYESFDIYIPNDIKEILQKKIDNCAGNESYEDSLNDLLNVEDQQIDSDLEDKSKTPEKKHENEVKINKKNGDSYGEVPSDVEKLNYFYPATLKRDILKRFSQIELKSNKSKENSELDSDDCSNMSTVSSVNQNQAKKENPEEYDESGEEYDEDQYNDGCKIVEIYSPMGQDDEINTGANYELSTIKTEDIPVFDDNESLSDDSEMDVCIEYDFLSQFYHQLTDLPKKGCSVKEITDDLPKKGCSLKKIADDNRNSDDEKFSENSEDNSI